MNEIVKLDPKEYGLEESKARQIEAAFVPMLEKMVELENEFNAITAMPVSEGACCAAKTLRMKYVKVRTGTAAIHKELKAFYLAGGRFVDGWKNAQLFASEGMEKKLSEIENHFEIMEQKRREKLSEERKALLAPYEADMLPVDFASMGEYVFGNFLAGAKHTFELKKEAERMAEAERIEKEKAEVEALQKMRLENEWLKAEAIDEAKRQEALRKEFMAAEKRKQAELQKQLETERIEKMRLEHEQAEHERILAEAEAEAEKRKQHAMDKLHRESVEIGILKALGSKILQENALIVLGMLQDGEVPNVVITY